MTPHIYILTKQLGCLSLVGKSTTLASYPPFLSSIWATMSMADRDAATMRVITELKRIYNTKILPLEQLYMFDSFFQPFLTDAEFDSKPQVMLIGQYSVGKTSVSSVFDCGGGNGFYDPDVLFVDRGDFCVRVFVCACVDVWMWWISSFATL